MKNNKQLVDISTINLVQIVCDKFEGKEAIYIEKGALRVRVSDIRESGPASISANVEEIPTPGLGVGALNNSQRSRSIRWEIGACYLTVCSNHVWPYGIWRLVAIFRPSGCPRCS
jgi:hypothetical protein